MKNAPYSGQERFYFLSREVIDCQQIMDSN